MRTASALPLATFFIIAFQTALLGQQNKTGVADHWQTQRKHSSIQLRELKAFVPKDAFPALSPSKFWNQRQAQDKYHEKEPLVVVKVKNTEKAYPLQLLSRHGVINDWIGGLPVAITYCALSGSSNAYLRRFMYQGKQYQLDFALSGMLRQGNSVLWDGQTETWWQQINGHALAGQLKNVALKSLPFSLLNPSQFFEAYPYGLLMAHEPTSKDWYYHNPYYRYDHPSNEKPELLSGMPKGPFPPTERLLFIKTPRGEWGVPWRKLQAAEILELELAGDYVVIFYQTGTQSLHDAHDIRQGKEVGHANGFSAYFNGRRLHFLLKDGQITDLETASVWNFVGQATQGPLKGNRLEALPNSHVAFSFAAFGFYPNIIVP